MYLIVSVLFNVVSAVGILVNVMANRADKLYWRVLRSYYKKLTVDREAKQRRDGDGTDCGVHIVSWDAADESVIFRAVAEGRLLFYDGKRVMLPKDKIVL